MTYTSTRDNQAAVSAAEAITRGISPEGGLFVPSSIPALTMEEIQALAGRSYPERADAVLGKYLTDFTREEVAACTAAAYSPEHFRAPEIAPLRELEEGVHILELWHGPTCAFKDMALQILPHLMRVSAEKTLDGKEIVILVATSGDTGKAALEGFRDASGTRILVFYPEDGVSPMQKLQMTTQDGDNVAVCAIRGNFDDAQTGVKAIFTDPIVGEKLKEHHMLFSSANSINWGRLAPQIVYYISAYSDLLRTDKIRPGDPINIVVPTGNFGNILAAYYAGKMGLPIRRLICASNRNRVLTDFIRTGVYDRNRDFYTTTSPSMDILISSNLERLLYDLSGGDAAEIRGMMASLAKEGRYQVTEGMREAIQSQFSAGWCDDRQAAEAIAETFRRHGYLLDTHTAVAMHVYREYRRETGDDTPAVIASTANPYKFAASVLAALGDACGEGDEFARLEELERKTGCPVPPPLAALRGKAPRFTGVCDREGMREVVYSMLHIAE